MTMIRTVAYCRVSTDEQAAEGYSIEGQAEKLRDYARVHELGAVQVVVDAGLSGKDMDRPGLQQVLALVEDQLVDHVIVWRLDRLSRNLEHLIMLADRFGQQDVALHSFTERIDLSTATGRMFYNILGSFAQFYREQLAENVTMGMARARAEGRWTNRPPTGYDLIGGFLIPNEHASTVRRIFDLRAGGASYNAIEAKTNVKHSTVVAILKNRAYIGEMRHKDTWLPGIHEPLVPLDLFEAAHKGRIAGRKRGKDLLSGRVICGLCRRRMSIDSNGQGQQHYRCKHRGSGCKITGRSNTGLLNAFLLAAELLCDEEIRSAVRGRIEDRRQAGNDRRRRTSSGRKELERLEAKRNKLLNLHFDGHISAEQFGDQQAKITQQIENLAYTDIKIAEDQAETDALASAFEQVIELLEQLDLADIWQHGTEQERRAFVDELLDNITIKAECLTVTIHGAPPLNVGFSEVGLKDSGLSRVGGGT